MRGLVTSIAISIAQVIASPVNAECTYPTPPGTIPNAKTASQSDMVTAMQTFKAYSEKVKDYGACLDEEVNSKATSINTSQLRMMKELQLKKHNTAIAELQAKTKEFNEQVKAFQVANTAIIRLEP